MKKIKFYILCAFIASLSATSCKKTDSCIYGEGQITEQTILVPEFTGIDLATSAKVIVTQGNTQEVKVSAQPNIIAKLTKNVSEGIWNINLENGCYEDYELTVYITVPNIENILLSGSGNIKVYDFSNQRDLSTNLSGSGTIEISAFNGTKNLFVNISGSGKIIGYSNFLNLTNETIKISGSGSFEGFPIQTENCSIFITGSGNAFVLVKNVLNVQISGSGSVFYKGNPSLTKTITGSGKVENSN